MPFDHCLLKYWFGTEPNKGNSAFLRHTVKSFSVFSLDTNRIKLSSKNPDHGFLLQNVKY